MDSAALTEGLLVQTSESAPQCSSPAVLQSFLELFSGAVKKKGIKQIKRNHNCESVQSSDAPRTHLRGRPRGRLSPTGSTFCKRPESLIIMSCHAFPQRLLGHLRSIFFKVEQIQRSRVKNSSNNK